MPQLESQLRETDSGLSLHHLSVWMVEPTNRLKLLVSIVNAVKEGRKRGGALISTVYTFLHHGDPTASQTVHSLLCTVRVKLEYYRRSLLKFNILFANQILPF